MKLTKNILTLSALFFLLLTVKSCIIYDFKHETEIVYAPQMETTFGSTTAPVLLNDAEVYIFDSEDFLVQQTQLTAKQLQTNENVQIIKGVDEGQYTMLAYYNVANLSLPALKLGAKISEVTASLKYTDDQLIPGGFTYENIKDSTCYSRDKFVVQRGSSKTYLKPIISHAHFAYNFSVEGLEQVSGSLGDVTVQLLNLPVKLDADSRPQSQGFDQFITLVADDPTNQYSNKTGTFMSMVFDSQDEVYLQLYEDGQPMQNLLLNPELYVDSVSKNIMNVRIVFSVDTYIVMINDWYQSFEYINFGG